MNAFWLDVRYAARIFRRAPVLTAVAVLTLGLGIGANASMFTVVNALLLRPLPYPSPESLVEVWGRNTTTGERGTLSPVTMLDLQEGASRIEAMAVYGYGSQVLTGDARPEPVRTVSVTSSFFDVLRIPPRMGRVLRPEDDAPDAAPALVLSEGYFDRRFGSDPSIVGATIRLDGVAHTVVGVMPAAFAFPDASVDAWRAARIDFAAASRGTTYLFGIARLRAGTDPAAAQREVSALASRLEAEYPGNTNAGLQLVPLHEAMVEEARPALLALMAAVGFVLLIACANVTNLLVARASGRTGEVAVRRALGAGRRRLVGQFLIEGGLLTAAGGVAGVLIAAWGLDVIQRLAGGTLGSASGLGVDWRVIAFTTTVLAGIGLTLGLAQALVFGRIDAAGAIRASGRGAGSGRTRQRVRATLAGAQLALALPLLVGATLLLRTVGNLRDVPAGFDPDGVISMSVQLPDTRYDDHERQAAFVTSALDRIAGIPGVQVAGMTTDLPFSGSRSTSSFNIEGRPAPEPGRQPIADVRNVSPDYFRAMGIDVLRGRAFDERDRQGSMPVVIINATLAQRFFPGEDALGKRLLLRNDVPTEIVGIIDDVRHDDLRAAAPAEFYRPIAQQWTQRLFIAARVDGDPSAFATPVADAILAVDPELPPVGVRTMNERLERWMTPQRITLRLLGAFAGVAILLAAMGLYGVVSYAVSQRSRELGIRMALGADRREILRLVIGQGARMIVAGLAVGLLAALAVARALSSLLFGVGTVDPLSFAAVSAVLAAVALVACWLPAVRAARVDPLHVLRHE
jgi:putative ABC transport system permease protein